jgi:phosphatidylglycerol lysyltransferase
MGMILFIIALVVIYHKLRNYHYHQIVVQVKQISFGYLIAAIVLTLLDYFTLTGYDAMGLRYIGHKLQYRRIALASFVGYAFSHNATIFGGSAARYRIYSSLGVSATEVAKLIAFCVLTFWLGFFTLGGIVFILQPQHIPNAIHLPFVSVRPIGIIFLLIVTAYLLQGILKKQPIRVKEWELVMPSVKLSVGQVLISLTDWMLAGGVLYVLLPKTMHLTYIPFLGIFLLAQITGLLSYVPGGLGVFETVIVLLLSGYGSSETIIGSLLLYRLIYYLLPFCAASVILITYEAAEQRKSLKRVGVVAGRWSSAMIPYVIAVTTLISGAVLLFSGALPAVRGRMIWLRDFLPLPAIEISHFLGSLVGAYLLILARGLQRRLKIAYHLTLGLLIAGMVLSLVKGLDYEESLILGFMLILLFLCRGKFYRGGTILSYRFTNTWIVFVAIIVFSSVWLGVFSYKHIEYSHQLWWQFVVHGDASRFLRAMAGVVVFLLLYSLAKLIYSSKPELVQIESADLELEKVRNIVNSSPKIYANLALLGDKKFLFNEGQNAFIMYGVEKRSWISMGDPVGPSEEWEELIWRFRELCDRHDGWPVFYQVDGANLSQYVDLGLSFIKIGEEAKVDLTGFSLEGGLRKDLRYAHNKMQKLGCSFSIIPQEDVSGRIDDFRKISDAWLESRNTREKGFSLGYFSPEYISNFPIVAVWQNDRVIAFANIWSGAGKEELSVDLMRYFPDCPDDVMDYLFTGLLLWGRGQGYKWFNFGMAPLSGLEDRAMAPFWSKAGVFLFRYGEHFYNFQGLRHYKDKYGPVWEPKYLVCPRGLMLPRILTNLVSLVSGSFTGAIKK